MALKGNPFDKEVPRPQLPIIGSRIKPKFEKIELGAVPPPHNQAQETAVKGVRLDHLVHSESIEKAKTIITTPAYVEPNLSQSGAKVEPNLSQSGAKVEPNLSQNKVSESESRAKVEPQLEPNYEPKLSQTRAKVEPNLSISIVVGLQRKILFYLYEMCRFLGKKISSPINIRNLSETLGTTPSAARKAIQRLEEKGFLDRVHYKNGRGGWSQYRLPDNTYNELLHEETRAKVEPKLSQTRAKVEPQLEPQLEPKFSSSSSIYVLEDLKTTTTSPDEKTQLSEDWKVINYSSLTEQGLQFSESHLLQLAQRTKHTPKMVQDAIEFFGFDLKHNDKRASIKGDPISFFMGIMQRGMYTAPCNFVDPAEAELDRYLAQQKAKLARMQEKLAEKENLDFEIWLLETTEEQRRKIAPQAKQDLGEMQKGILRSYWKISKNAEQQTNSLLE